MYSLRNILIAALLFGPALVLAQVPEPVQYAVAPEAPGPQSQVVIEVGGVGSLLGDSEITWRKDGAVVLRGTGESRYTFTTGALGTRTSVSVTIDSAQGTFSRTFNFSPSLVNLVWEADTTVPPLFLGKPLYSGGSPLRILALPVVYSGSARVAQSALSYQWSLGDEPLQAQSGLGRSVLSFVGDNLKQGEEVSLNLYYGAAKVAQASIIVPAVDPALVLYERDPLRGLVLDTAFPTAAYLTGKEATLEAVPFYFSTDDARSGSLVYEWLLNGESATGPDTARGVLTLRQTGSGAGAAIVEVGLQNNATFTQQASARLQLVFGADTSLLNNLFGI